MEHHHIGTLTSGQTTLLPKVVVTRIDLTATARISSPARGPWVQIDAHPITGASRTAGVVITQMSQMDRGRVRTSRIVSVAMTLTDQTGVEHALLSKIASVVAQLDRTAQEHVRVFATMLPHVIEDHNLVHGIRRGSLIGLTVITTIVRHADVPLIDLVYIALSKAYPVKNRHAIHVPSVRQTATPHTVMIPPDHGVISSLRGTMNISILMLHLAHGVLKNAQAVIESATRLLTVM
jgi:hypothetical protein